jgi:hypothetical protein
VCGVYIAGSLSGRPVGLGGSSGRGALQDETEADFGPRKDRDPAALSTQRFRPERSEGPPRPRVASTQRFRPERSEGPPRPTCVGHRALLGLHALSRRAARISPRDLVHHYGFAGAAEAGAYDPLGGCAWPFAGGELDRMRERGIGADDPRSEYAGLIGYHHRK